VLHLSRFEKLANVLRGAFLARPVQ